MKKFLLILVAMLTMTSVSFARDKYSRDTSVLPRAAQSVLSRNFKADVSLIKIEKGFGRVSEYDVTLTDGTEISFDRKGNWENIETSRGRRVPDALVPQTIRNYVKKNHSGAKIIGIERERGGYEVELDNGIDMKFDRAGNFKRYDK